MRYTELYEVFMHSWQRLFAVHLKPELKELYLFSVLFSFASALILIFEPVFFYQQGKPPATIALYYALHYTLYLFVLPFGGKFAARFGYERSLAISLPVFVLYFLSLAAMPTYPRLFWVALLLLTTHKIFYWPAYHATFARFGDVHNRGTELSWMHVLKYGVGVAGPMIGGFIASQFGFPVLFVLVAATILFSAVPLLLTEEHYRAMPFPYRAPWDIIRSRQHRGMVLTMAGMGENLIDMVFWPLWLFIILGSVALLGAVASFALGVMAALGFFVGELADRYSRQKVLRLHLPFLVISHLFRPFAVTPARALLTDTLSRMSFIGVTLPMTYRLYTQGIQAGVLQYIVAFEIVLCIAKATTAWLLIAVFSSFVPFTAFTLTFSLAALLALFYVFL